MIRLKIHAAYITPASMPAPILQRSHEKQPAMGKLHSLQALRGIAVLAVLLFHMIAVEGKYNAGATLFAYEALWLQLGVDLFFVISGFVMVLVTRNRFQKPRELGRFLFIVSRAFILTTGSIFYLLCSCYCCNRTWSIHHMAVRISGCRFSLFPMNKCNWSWSPGR